MISDNRKNQDAYDVIQAKAEYEQSRPAHPLNDTAKTILEHALDNLRSELEEAERSCNIKKQRLEEAEKWVKLCQERVTQLEEALDVKRDDEAGAE